MWEEGVWEKKGRIWNGDHHGGPGRTTSKGHQEERPGRSSPQKKTSKQAATVEYSTNQTHFTHKTNDALISRGKKRTYTLKSEKKNHLGEKIRDPKREDSERR